MSLRPYVGEYLISPVPLHFGLNYCSHGCGYCFANLNNPARRADNTDLRWLLKWDKSQDQTLVGWFLSRGYPLLVSNDSDPLAASNEETFRELDGICRRKAIPLCFQTKGGKPEMQELMLDRAPTMIYITITTDREDIHAAAEPGAPSFQHRLALAREAKRRGHHVVIGINPLVPEWWDDFPRFCAILAESGISHVWAGAMHLNYRQIANIPEKWKQRFAGLIKDAQSKSPPDSFALIDLEDHGINVFSSGSAAQPGFWDAYFELGYPFFPTMDGWKKYMDETYEGMPTLFSLHDFNEWSELDCPLERSAFKEYLHGVGRSMRNLDLQVRAKNFREVHEQLWEVMKWPTIFRDDELYIAIDYNERGTMEVCKDDDRYVFAYLKGVFKKELVFDIASAPYAIFKR